jgi:hypothetical protein
VELVLALFAAIITILSIWLRTEIGARKDAEKAIKEIKTPLYADVILSLFSLQDELSNPKRETSVIISEYQQKIFKDHKRSIMLWAGEDVIQKYMSLLEFWKTSHQTQSSQTEPMTFARSFLCKHADLVLSMRKELGFRDKFLDQKFFMEKVFGDSAS